MVTFISAIAFHVDDDVEFKFHNYYGKFGHLVVLLRSIISFYGILGAFKFADYSETNQ